MAAGNDDSVIEKFSKLKLKNKEEDAKTNIFSTFSYNFNQQNPYTAKIVPISFKHSINDGEPQKINDEKASYVDAEMRGKKFIVQIPEDFTWSLNVGKKEYENYHPAVDENNVFNLGSWTKEMNNLKDGAFHMGINTARNLMFLPFKNGRFNSHENELYINIENGKYKINGLKKIESTKDSKNDLYSYWGVKIHTYATSDTVGSIPKNNPHVIPSKIALMVLLENTFGNHTVYYMNDVNCLLNENMNSMENFIEIRTKVLSRDVIREIRRLVRSNKNPIVLEKLNAGMRTSIFDLIQGESKHLFEKEWAKLFLMGIQKLYMWLANEINGVTSDVLIIERKHIEEYYANRPSNNNMEFSPRKAITLFGNLLDWIKSLPLREGGRYTAKYNTSSKMYEVAEDETDATDVDSNNKTV